MSTKHCECGCGKKLPKPTNQNPRQNQRFIAGHQNRNNEAFRLMKAAARLRPPSEWTPPTGLCECGCGQTTTIAKSSNSERGFYAGYPRQFVRGHHMRLQSVGEGNNAWKGGRYMLDGYVMIRTGPRTYEGEHRLKWAAKHGPIPKGHHVHHKNGNRSDNRLRNLECLTMAAHKLLHQHGDLPAHNHFQTDEEMLTAAKLLAVRLKRLPTVRDLCKANGTPHHRTYVRRFGSMEKLRQAILASH